MKTLMLICCALASSACLRNTQYRCASDQSCGGAGMCETSGFCSFPDTECTSGRRYGGGAGSLGGSCTTGGGGDVDMMINPTIDMSMPLIDGAMTDTPVVAMCPAGYVTITGGNAGHMYKVLTAGMNWDNQEQQCQLTTVKSHLAVPDDITELTAIDTLAGGTTSYWVGVTDSVPPSTAEMTFYTILGVAATYLPWEGGAPDDGGPGEDCVEVNPATHQFNDERCNTSQRAVCECAP